MSELAKRAVFGSIYVLLIVGALLVENPLIFSSLLALFAFLGYWEYARLVDLNRDRPMRTILDGIMAAGCVYSAVAAMAFYKVLACYVMYIFVRSLFAERHQVVANLGKTLLGFVYIALPLALLALASVFGSLWGTFTRAGVNPVLYIFIAIWLNDTGAFLVGSRFGRHKLFPAVSPKKSWEGFFGGVAFVFLFFLLVIKLYLGANLSVFSLLLLALVLSGAATVGDLFESMLKRNAGVKDSGNLIPGHGGILDRIDSLLFVVPIVLIWMR